MKKEYGFSAKTKCFYPVDLIDTYKANGTLPDDIVFVDDKTFKEFTDFTVGFRTVGSNIEGFPEWVAVK